jgi:beta-glucosidase
MKVRVPIISGTNAVHGHSNVYGAMISPHDVGFGAAHGIGLSRDTCDIDADRR